MILHVDMDAFYASVEERERPELNGRPVIVGGSPEGRGVVCAANYLARKYGVRSAQPSSIAIRLCPNAVFLKPRFDLYTSVSRQIRDIFHRYTPLVEPLSLDEAFLDVAGSERLFGDGETIGRRVQTSIRSELMLPCSVGVASTKFVAKIASDLNKPNGFVFVKPTEVQSFLDPLSVSRIWGVGKKAEQKLAVLGIKRIGDLRGRSPDVLLSVFGNHGKTLWELANGIDNRPVVPDHDAKQISHETTFGEDITEYETLRAWLSELTANIGRRLRRQHRTAKTIIIKVRYCDFTTITRSRSLAEATNATTSIFKTADELLCTRLPKRRLSVRLLGIGVTGLSSADVQKHLFADDNYERRSSIDAVTDAIANRFGRDAVRSGLSANLKRSNGMM